jgi:alpha-ribazole phosphatase
MNKNMTEIVLIRHGKTAGNLRRNYIGRTDEPLCAEGVAELRRKIAAEIYPPVELLFCSPMRRCLETAALIYPGIEPTVIDDLRECDFGDFENKNYLDLSGNAEYQKWVDSGGRLPFPNGDGREAFAERCCRGFEQAASQLLRVKPKRAAFVVHGGTIMALVEHYAGCDYFEAGCDNGCGWQLNFDEQLWLAEKRLTCAKRLP